MRSEDEVRERLKRFKEYCQLAKDHGYSDELVRELYGEKIDILNWVLEGRNEK